MFVAEMPGSSRKGGEEFKQDRQRTISGRGLRPPLVRRRASIAECLSLQVALCFTCETNVIFCYW